MVKEPVWTFQISESLLDLDSTPRTNLYCGPGSVVGIATAYGLDGPGIESRWGEILRTSPDRP